MIVHTNEWDYSAFGKMEHYYECDNAVFDHAEQTILLYESGKIIAELAIADIVEFYDNNCSL